MTIKLIKISTNIFNACPTNGRSKHLHNSEEEQRADKPWIIPISLPSTIGKALEKRIASSLPQKQYGFRLNLTNIFFKIRASFFNLSIQQTYTHRILKFPTQLIKVILLDRKHPIIFQSSRSTPFTSQAGIPQGLVSAPLLFMLYTSDFPQQNGIWWTCAKFLVMKDVF